VVGFNIGLFSISIITIPIKWWWRRRRRQRRWRWWW